MRDEPQSRTLRLMLTDRSLIIFALTTSVLGVASISVVLLFGNLEVADDFRWLGIVAMLGYVTGVAVMIVRLLRH